MSTQIYDGPTKRAFCICLNLLSTLRTGAVEITPYSVALAKRGIAGVGHYGKHENGKGRWKSKSMLFVSFRLVCVSCLLRYSCNEKSLWNRS
jgi:hypothetical protein